MKKVCGVFMLFALISLLLVACGGGPTGGNVPGGGTTATVGGATATAGAPAGNTVGLAAVTFSPDSITIKKGDSITLTNQTATVHIIANGSWSNGAAAPKVEAGAPVVNNTTVSSSGQTLTVGPFNTAGTFHYYCSVHPNMNLTVTVQ